MFFFSYLSYSKNFFLTKFFDLGPSFLIPPFFGTPCTYIKYYNLITYIYTLHIYDYMSMTMIY